MTTTSFVRSRPRRSNRRMLDDEAEETSLDDYVRECTSQEDRTRYQSTDSRSQSFQCCFCQKLHSSSIALSDHLMLCGNKTDLCPKCRKFIRRAIFAYHYENECASLEETDAATPRPKNPSANHLTSKSDSSKLREYDQEDDSSLNSSNKCTKILDATSSSDFKRSDLSDIVISKSSHNRPLSSDHKVDQDNPCRNSTETNKKPIRTSQLLNETECIIFYCSCNPGIFLVYLFSAHSTTNAYPTSHDVVYVPCDICSEQIDLRRWSNHSRVCRDKDNRRIATLAEKINREPVTEKISCEHCEALFPVQRLQYHEFNCEKNPLNSYRVAKLRNSRPSSTIVLTNESSKTDGDLTLFSTYLPFQSTSLSVNNHSTYPKNTLGQTNDRERTRTSKHRCTSSHVQINDHRINDIPRLNDNGRSSLTIDRQSRLRQRRSSSNFDSTLINSSAHVSTHNASSGLKTERFPAGTQPSTNILYATKPPERKSESYRATPTILGSTAVDSRVRLTSRNFVDARGSHRLNTNKPIQSCSDSDNTFFESPRSEDYADQPKLNQKSRPQTSNINAQRNPILLQPPMKYK
ncbi:unnamed protein product [Rotaria magnacalcarata]|uniref:XIAP-associated factor 1 n=4 Tax=Rotaria magnacalcarata TaxID=392030 RepID=A0A814G8Z7_9BILA|nr:unnamed protein product [Rotaria magnacalcarata]CAF1469382.1 unnamed protein product [Rotaria magnacalcarata]